jgi:ferritin-like metal-binding protein YciE
MAESLDSQLVKYLEDAHALEQHVLRQLDGMIKTTPDPELKEHLKHHKEETGRHRDLLGERLRAHGAEPSMIKDAGSIFGALGKGLMDIFRSDNAGKNARDGFVAEHMEIASYELLERVARIAGDEATVEVARRNRADEESMSEKIAASWDRVVVISLRQEGVSDEELARARATTSAAR